MLDQNTDRMWYVIGAIIVGAALIFVMLTTSTTSVGAVEDMFTTQIDNTSGYIDRHIVAMSGPKYYGESIQNGVATPNNPVAIDHVDRITVNDVDVQLDTLLRGVGPVRDVLFYDGESWKIERRVKEVVLTGDSDWKTEQNHWYVSFDDVSKKGYGTIISHFELTHGVLAENELPQKDEDMALVGSRYGNNRAGLKHNKNLLFYMSEHDDLVSWKQWVAENPMTVIYELDKPVIEDVSSGLAKLMNEAMFTGDVV